MGYARRAVVAFPDMATTPFHYTRSTVARRVTSAHPRQALLEQFLYEGRQARAGDAPKGFRLCRIPLRVGPTHRRAIKWDGSWRPPELGQGAPGAVSGRP